MHCFADIYRGRKVLVTGHTGFKGSWLCLWLQSLGAHLTGYSLAPSNQPNHFNLLSLKMDSVIADLRDRKAVHEIVAQCQPEIIFHLAAQALVRRSYRDPFETYETNVMGTLHLLDACRITPSVRAVVCITSDKVYENTETATSFVESDHLGGYDPYSSSKACSELLIASYRNSYFHPSKYGKEHHTLLASVRAGNVIGGGDWAEDRIIPDAVTLTAVGKAVRLRNPHAIRPWQHVLDPLSGYLTVGRRLIEGHYEDADAWNFGPEESSCVTVERLIQKLQEVWPAVKYLADQDNQGPKESTVLKLNSAKAKKRLAWEPVWNFDDALIRTATWYKRFYKYGEVSSLEDLHAFLSMC